MNCGKTKRVLCSNRRQAPRFDVDLKGLIFSTSQQGTGAALEVRIQNLSAQGAQISSKTRIPVGESLIVIINNALRFRCKITRVREAPCEGFHLGVLMEAEEPAANSPQNPDARQVGVEPVSPVLLAETETINHVVFRKDNRLNKVLRFVEGHYDERISLKQAADIAAMEVTYFSSFFHQKVGLTYLNWLQHLRVTKAISLLSDENLSITEIAYQVGFNDLRTFQRAFKKHTRLTPRALREKLSATA